MPIFKFVVSRNITESISMEVEAASIEEAHEKGLKAAGECDGWNYDDCSEQETYIPDPGEYEEILEQKPEFVIRAVRDGIDIHSPKHGFVGTANLADARRWPTREEAELKLARMRGWGSMNPVVVPLHAHAAQASNA